MNDHPSKEAITNEMIIYSQACIFENNYYQTQDIPEFSAHIYYNPNDQGTCNNIQPDSKNGSLSPSLSPIPPTPNIPIWYDSKHYIHCYWNLPDEEYRKLVSHHTNFHHVSIKKSHYNIITYRANINSHIYVSLILIVDSLEVIPKEENEISFINPNSYRDNVNINNDPQIFTNLKDHLTAYLKDFDWSAVANQCQDEAKAYDDQINESSCSGVETILLGKESVFGKVRFMGNVNNIDTNGAFSKAFINEIGNVSSPLEINPQMKPNDDLFINNLTVWTRESYHKELKEKYLEEIPESISKWISKYKNFNFTKQMFEEYKQNMMK